MGLCSQICDKRDYDSDLSCSVLQEVDHHNERPINYVSCISPLLKPQAYDNRFGMRKQISFEDARSIAMRTRELEDFQDVKKYLN